MERGRERGLMRASARAATLSNNGVRWLKYNCTRESYSENYYTAGDWIFESNGYAATMNGSSSYSFDSSSGTFTCYGTKNISENAGGGTIYILDDPMQVSRVVMDNAGEWTRHTESAQGPYTRTYTDYYKGTYVGAIYADEGIYPDAEANYVYVTTFTDSGVTYTVMRNGSTYYCYCKG